MPLTKGELCEGFKEGGRAARVAEATLSNADTRAELAEELMRGPKNVAAALRRVGDCERVRPTGADNGPGVRPELVACGETADLRPPRARSRTTGSRSSSSAAAAAGSCGAWLS